MKDEKTVTNLRSEQIQRLEKILKEHAHNGHNHNHKEMK